MKVVKVVPDPRVPVLWLCGPAGVGKSTVSWQLYAELAGSGGHVAFADSDQLCMCYPAPAGDPDRQHLKQLNAGSVIRNFRSAGARCVIVNGVLGPAGLATWLLPEARVTVCRLRADADEVQRRFTARDGHRDGMEGLLREVRDDIRLMDESSFADACVDTTGIPAADVPGLVRAACRDWPGFTGRLEEAGGQVPAPPGPAVGGRVAGEADLRRYARELPGTDVALLRLRAGRAELRRRIMTRGAGGSWPEPGDRLRGQSAEFLASAADQAVRAAAALDRSDAAGPVIDTTRRSPDESASVIRDAIGWPWA